MLKAYYADYIWYDNKLQSGKWLLTEDDKITGCADIPGSAYEQYKFENSAIYPTFINTHTHVPMNLLRGYADDLPLHEWLNGHIWPAEKRLLCAEFVKDACMLAAAELIRGGVSCVNDMYFFNEVEMEVFNKIGLRGVFGFPTMAKKRSEKLFDKIESLIEEYKDKPLINMSISPHAIYTAARDVYEFAVEIVDKYGLILHTHLSETEFEVENCKKEYGKSPVEIMNEIGAFDCKSVFAHCVRLTDAEIELMGGKKVNVAHCIQSNFKLASGFTPAVKLMKAGANVTIATDGASSNNDLDMLSEIQTAALFHKAYSNDPTAFNAETALMTATTNAAKALYLDNTGTLKDGYQADFMVVSYDSPHMQPVFHPVSNFIYSGQKNDITDVFVAGKQLLKDRQLTCMDEKEVLAKTKEWVKRITII